jgi:hypothetical protein
MRAARSIAGALRSHGLTASVDRGVLGLCGSLGARGRRQCHPHDGATFAAMSTKYQETARGGLAVNNVEC